MNIRATIFWTNNRSMRSSSHPWEGCADISIDGGKTVAVLTTNEYYADEASALRAIVAACDKLGFTEKK